MSESRRKSQSGNTIVEFALGWSLLWLLFMGIYSFGYTFYVYNLLMTCVSNAAEMASKLPYDTANTSAYTTSVTNMVLYGDITAGSNVIVPGLTSSNININVNPEASMPTDITITIKNFTINSVFNSWTFTGKPSVTTVYMGQITCSSC